MIILGPLVIAFVLAAYMVFVEGKTDSPWAIGIDFSWAIMLLILGSIFLVLGNAKDSVETTTIIVAPE